MGGTLRVVTWTLLEKTKIHLPNDAKQPGSLAPVEFCLQAPFYTQVCGGLVVVEVRVMMISEHSLPSFGASQSLVCSVDVEFQADSSWLEAGFIGKCLQGRGKLVMIVSLHGLVERRISKRCLKTGIAGC